MKKIISLILLFLFVLSSCSNLEKNKNISTVSILEEKWENKTIQQDSFSSLQTFCNQFIKAWKYYKNWSKTTPAINETHIFCGEINSRWKPVWFHSKINWKIPETVKILKTEKQNKYWVYNWKVLIYDIKQKKFKAKFSSIFPDNLSKQQVEEAIIRAWKHKYYYKNSQFRWKSWLGFEIWWYTYKNKINTAYPIYKK